MATVSSSTITPINDTDAHFQNWAGFIESVFQLSSTWVQTSDTGQASPASAAHPTVANTKVCYQIYRMNDSLQSTFPVYLKINYGSGAAANTPAIWIEIGKGSDGSGGITTTRFAEQRFSSGTNNSANHQGYGSADTNRITFCSGTGGTQRGIILGIERSKDTSGNDTSDGLIIIGTQDAAIINRVWYVRMNEVAQPDLEFPAYIRSINGAFDSNVALGIIIPIAGIPKQPGPNFFVSRSGDFSQTGAPTVDIYGATVQLQGLDSCQAALYTGSQDTNSRIFMRYE